MTRALLAGFPTPDALTAAARAAAGAGSPALDAFTPFPIPELDPLIGAPAPRVGRVVLAAALAVGAGVFALELWSVSYGYIYDSGGRPANSWPAFLAAPVEFAILAAALAGFGTFLAKTGLPRLNHPLFDRLAFERASQDQFVLALPADAPDVRALAFAHGAVWVEGAEA